MIEINLILKDELEYIIYYKLKKYIKIIFFFYFFKFIKNDTKIYKKIKILKKSKFYTLTHAKPINV